MRVGPLVALMSDEAHHEVQVKVATMIGLAALAATFTSGFLLDIFRVHWLPESAAAVLIGVLACQIVSYSADTDLMSMMKFDMEFFMNWLIPPIIFEAAFNMNVAAFFANIGPVSGDTNSRVPAAAGAAAPAEPAERRDLASHCRPCALHSAGRSCRRSPSPVLCMGRASWVLATR